MLKEYYSGKKVFVTGHTGFKGSWLLVLLKALNANVKGYALEPPEDHHLFNMIEGQSLCESEIGNINDMQKLKKSILTFQPDIVIHLAAQALVRVSYESPLETYQTNVIGTANVLDAVRALDKKCEVVCITTDKVYENKEWYHPYRESDRLGGYDPYSSSKACVEILINSFRLSFFNFENYSTHLKCIASARAGNVIGGGDYAKDRIIPDIIRSFTKREPVNVRSPFAIRPWQHVIEPLIGYLKLGKLMAENPLLYGDAWNFGPQINDNISVGELVNICINNWGEGEMIVPEEQEKLHEAGILKLDISKTVQFLKWKPVYSSEIAISETIQWYKSVAEGASPLQICENQISKYIKASDLK